MGGFSDPIYDQVSATTLPTLATRKGAKKSGATAKSPRAKAFVKRSPKKRSR